jgi:hypothetical protein
MAVLFDAIRNERFAIAVKSNGSIEYFGAEGQAREWTNWANSDVRNKSAELPMGIVIGPYKNVSEFEINQAISNLGYSEITNVKEVFSSKSYRNAGSVKVSNTSRVPSVYDTPVYHFPDSKYANAVNYKALAFRANIKQASALYEARVNNYVFNADKNHFIAKPGSLEEKTLRPRFESSMTRGIERRLGRKILRSMEEIPVRTKTGIIHELETKSLDFEFKSIGQRIGGGTRGARRAARFASATFDPNAWDGDGDGIVQEGTPFQRPAIPGVNDRSTRGNVDVSAATRAWENSGSSAERGSIARTPSRARTESAQVQQVERGMASRAERAKKKSKRRAVPGKDKVSETDGQWWAQLGDEQRKTVVENLRNRLTDLEALAKGSKKGAYGLLTSDGGWWQGWLDANRGVKDGDGKPFEFGSKIRGAALADLGTEIMDIIDDIDANKNLDDNKKAQEKQKYQRLLDDIKTLAQMDESDDFSLLEHLHPASRRAGLGDAGKSATGYKKVDGKVPAGLGDPKTVSSIHGRTGGAVVDETKAKVKKRDPKLKNLVRRLSEENPERARRRAQRRARRAGANVGGFTVDRENTKEKTKRRIRKAKRQLARRKTRSNIEAIARDAAKNKLKAVGIRKGPDGNQIETSGYVSRDADGKIIFTKEGVSAVFEALSIYRREKKPKSSKENREATFIASLWDAIGFNGTPHLVKDEEIPLLVNAGWKPIRRGHGEERWADEWLYDPERFVTGQKGEAAGPGEYWATQDGGWRESSYWGGPSEKGGTFAWLSPSAKTIKQDKLRQERQNANKLDTFSDGLIKILGGKGDQIDKDSLLMEYDRARSGDGEFASGSQIWDTEMGQVYSQLFELLRNGDLTTSQLQNALDGLSQAAKHENYLAPILGYDAIEVDDRVLVMNRAALVALDRPVSINEALEIGKNIEPPQVPSPPAQSRAPRVNGRLQVDSLKFVGGPLGSQAAGQYEDPATGERFYVKSPRTKLHGEVEVLGSKLVEMLGLNGVRMGFADLKGQEAIASTMLPVRSGKPDDPAFKKKVREMFVGLAWLGNRDTTGNLSNLKMDSKGNPIIIDHGDSTIFRARGDRKTDWGTEVGEMFSLRDPSINRGGATYFGDISEKEIADQVKAIGKISDKQIMDLVNSTISDPAEAKQIADTLIARRDWLTTNWSKGRKA